MEDIRLNLNENPLGSSPLVAQAVIDAASNLNRYGNEEELEHQLSVRHGVGVENVLIGNGSIELLDTVARNLLSPENNAVTPRCSFAAYSLITRLAASELRRADVGVDFAFVDGVLDAVDKDTRVIWFPNPNNPTGKTIEGAQIRRLLKQVDTNIAVVLDEAYIDFIDSDRDLSIELMSEHSNLIVSRTFSKAHGIAGLRIGYLIASEQIVCELKNIRLPMSVSALAIAAAQAALFDSQHLETTRRFVRDEREKIYDAFMHLGVNFIPSTCNFITFHMDDSEKIKGALESKAIFIKELSEFGMPGFLRVSIGSAADNERFIKEITNLVKEF